LADHIEHGPPALRDSKPNSIGDRESPPRFSHIVYPNDVRPAQDRRHSGSQAPFQPMIGIGDIQDSADKRFP
jgi:hypothetical protein